MSHFVTSWTLDGVSALWSSVFNLSAITVVGPIMRQSAPKRADRLLRTVPLSTDWVRPLPTIVFTFLVRVGSADIHCCREIHNDPEETYKATMAFRNELLEDWGRDAERAGEK